MKRNMPVVFVALLAVLTMIAVTSEVKAASYPDKIIEFVCHTAAGGGADAFLRAVSLHLNDEGIVKPKIQVSNRVGGGGTVAINYLADNRGNPNVLMGWTTAPLGAILRGTSALKDPMELALLCTLAEDPNLLVVRDDSKYRTLKDLMDDAKKNPDKVRGSVGSIGGTEHLIMNRMENVTGVKFNVTAFGGQSYVPVLGGHVDFTVSTPVDVLQNVKAGKLRILATVGDARIAVAPEVPTLKEQGVNTSFRQYRGLWGPPAMPDYAVKFWGQAFAKLFETRVFKEFLKKFEMEPIFMGPEQFRKLMPDYAKELAADVKALEVFGGKKN